MNRYSVIQSATEAETKYLTKNATLPPKFTADEKAKLRLKGYSKQPDSFFDDPSNYVVLKARLEPDEEEGCLSTVCGCFRDWTCNS
jgi:hypothetical protein